MREMLTFQNFPMAILVALVVFSYVSFFTVLLF